MKINHNVGENEALYIKYGIEDGQHVPATEELCEVIRILERKIEEGTKAAKSIGDVQAKLFRQSDLHDNMQHWMTMQDACTSLWDIRNAISKALSL